MSSSSTWNYIPTNDATGVSRWSFTVGIATASPGIIAMALGTFLISHNTSSKSIVPIYGGTIEDVSLLRDAIKDADAILDEVEAIDEGEKQ